jgi:hypothetical protein
MNDAEDTIEAKQAQLDLMWDKIQELKHKDTFAAQCLYEKYKVMLEQLPPPLPVDATDQAASQ